MGGMTSIEWGTMCAFRSLPSLPLYAKLLWNGPKMVFWLGFSRDTTEARRLRPLVLFLELDVPWPWKLGRSVTGKARSSHKGAVRVGRTRLCRDVRTARDSMSCASSPASPGHNFPCSSKGDLGNSLRRRGLLSNLLCLGTQITLLSKCQPK